MKNETKKSDFQPLSLSEKSTHWNSSDIVFAAQMWLWNVSGTQNFLQVSFVFYTQITQHVHNIHYLFDIT